MTWRRQLSRRLIPADLTLTTAARSRGNESYDHPWCVILQVSTIGELVTVWLSAVTSVRMPTIPVPKPTASRSHNTARGQLSREAASATPGSRGRELWRSSGWRTINAARCRDRNCPRSNSRDIPNVPLVAPLQGALLWCTSTQGAPHARRPWALVWNRLAVLSTESSW